jgi:rhodanese-related sulfurtransferase/mannose-6-phosphate isomerase-like protein (cupin superfamily)
MRLISFWYGFSVVEEGTPPTGVIASGSLIEMASCLALAVESCWAPFERHPNARSGLRILATDAYDVWLLSWPADTEISPHRHGDSNVAFAVVSGELEETHWQCGHPEIRAVRRGDCVAVGRGVVHEVRAKGGEAISVHVYSPPLSRMEFFDDQAERLLFVEPVDQAVDAVVMTEASVGSSLGGLEAVLDRARKRIAPRIEAEDLAAAMAHGALVVDTRPQNLRQQDGELEGAIVIDRNVLEWRLDPGGAHRISGASDPDRPVVVVCDEGYASSLAAAALLDLGRRNVTDLAGGYQAWKRMTNRRDRALQNCGEA